MRNLLLILLLCAEAGAQTPPWSPLVPASRAVDWSHVGVQIRSSTQVGCQWTGQFSDCVVRLPTNRTQCGATVPLSGRQDYTDAWAINNALQACAASPNTYVQLAAGTYWIVGGVTFGGSANGYGFTTYVNNVTLRGMGPDKTTLAGLTYGNQDCGPSGNILCLNGSPQGGQNQYNPYQGACSWTAGYAKGSTQLTIGSCIGGTLPSVGQHIILDQRNDDVGLTQCTSSGVEATCTVSTATLPPSFVVNACIGVGGVGNVPNMTFSTAARTSSTNYSLGTRITDTNGNVQTVTTAGQSAGTAPTNWSTTLGGTTNDGGVTWTMGMAAPAWQAGTAYAANAMVTDSNGRLQQARNGGTSGGSAPPWATTVLGTTTDGPITWTLTVWGASGSSYNKQAWSPQKYNPLLSPNGGQTCNQITAVSTNTFSYNLPYATTNLLPVGPCNTPTSPTPGNYTALGNQSSPWIATVCGWATVDTGGTYVSGTPCVTMAGNCGFGQLGGGLTIGRACPDPATSLYTALVNITCDPGEISMRSVTQVVTVTAQSGNVITIDDPLSGNHWRTEQRPGFYWVNNWLHDDGIEDLTVDGRNDGGTTSNGSMAFIDCYNCWVRNIRSIGGSRDHMWIQDGVAHMTVRDSYFWGTKRGATQSYGIEFYGATSFNLAENNLTAHVVAGILNGGLFGGVESYNYLTDSGYNNIPWLLCVITVNHDINGDVLMESNNNTCDSADDIHGTISGPYTIFRSRNRGQDTPFRSNALTGQKLSVRNRGWNYIGNVMGTPGAQVRYQANWPGANQYMGNLYSLGSTDQNGTTIPDDPLLPSSIMRWGNYNVVSPSASNNGPPAILWCGTGSEAGCSPCVSGTGSACSEMAQNLTFLPATPVPASQTLPPSFYLTAKPGWFTTSWGTPPWPAIGPDISNGNNLPTNCVGQICGDDPSGYTNMLPAQLVYQNAPLDAAFLEPQTVTQATWSAGYVTLTGTFTVATAGTFLVTGMNPSAYNGLYNLYASNGPSNDAGVNASAATASPGIGTAGYYLVSTTRVNSHGETSKSGSQRVSITATQGISVTAPCQPVSVAGLVSNCVQSGASLGGADASTYYNVYIGRQTVTGPQFGLPNAVLCKQNAAPLPLTPSSSSAILTPPYLQSGPIILPTDSNCIVPPLLSTATASIIQYPFNLLSGAQAPNPGGTGTGGTVTYPLIQVFNADSYYGGATPPPATGPNGITGHGQITGNGKIT